METNLYPKWLDWIGFFTFSVSLFLLVFALVRGNDDGWSSSTIVSLLAASAVLMVIFFVNELKTKDPISRFRGNWYDFRNTKLLATYHPAYLLRNPAAKSEVWKDLQKVMAHLGLKAKKASR